MKRHVIIGNSHAAIAAVEAIRSVNRRDEIVIVSKEDCPPYSPALTTYFLGGQLPWERLFFLGEDFYQRLGVRTLFGNEVVAVNPSSRTIALDNGNDVPYDDLLIATGSYSFLPPVPGVDSPGVYTLWTADDARTIAEAAAEARRIAVIGAGLIGIQSMNAMIAQGKHVTVIEMLGQPMPRVLDVEGAKIVEERMSGAGIELYFNARVMSIEGGEAVKTLTLASGEKIEADIIIMAAGVRPNVKFLEGSGINVNQGVVVDERSQTNIASIYAAGDVTESYDPLTGGYGINATIPNATEQGRTAGLNMAGRRIPRIRSVRINVFTPLGLSCASAGPLGDGDDRYDVVTQRKSGNYRKLVFDGDRLVGTVLVGLIDEAGLLISLIEQGQTYPGLRTSLERGQTPPPYSKVHALGGRLTPMPVLRRNGHS